MTRPCPRCGWITHEARCPQCGYPDTAPTTNGMAVAGMVCGIVGVVFGLIPLTYLIALVCGALGVVFGWAGYRRTRAGAPGRGMAIAGLVCGAVALILGVIGAVIVYGAMQQLENCC